ncbi:probable GPI-anchored adhesin-like protein PGA55 [Sergentomyia squamirostris]
MTSGLDTLIEAVNFVEQQDELSRQRTISSSSLSGQVTTYQQSTSFPPLSNSVANIATSSLILGSNTAANQTANILRYVQQHNQQASTSPIGSPVLNNQSATNPTGSILLSPNHQFPTLIRVDGTDELINNSEMYNNCTNFWKDLELSGTGASMSSDQINSEVTSSAPFYTSTVITDVGICVGMRNVNLNCDNAVCLYSQPTWQASPSVTKIPNCCNFSVFNQIMTSNDQQSAANRQTTFDDGTPRKLCVVNGRAGNRAKGDAAEMTQELLATAEVERQCSSATFAGVKVFQRDNSKISWLYTKSGRVRGNKVDDMTIGKTMALTTATIFKDNPKAKWLKDKNEEKSVKFSHAQHHNNALVQTLKMINPSVCSNTANCAPPKKKWIQHYFREEPLLNGHAIATPPLVVFSHPTQQHHHVPSGSSSTHSPSPQSSFELPRSRSSSGSSNHPTGTNGGTASATATLIHHVLVGGEDSSQSSINLNGGGSSGYLSGGSVNSVSGLNLTATVTNGGNASTMSTLALNGTTTIEQIQLQVQATSQGRRRTTSTNSSGAGTREVHNKLEKNRRAHLKECFEQLKKQLPQMPEEKKTSNLSILSAAIRYIQTLKRKERELEHEMERLAKEKISSQQRIIVLKRELSSQFENIDFSTILPETDSAANSIRERESSTEPPMSLGTVARYGSSSSLISTASNAVSPSPGQVCQIGSPVMASPTRKSTISPHPVGSTSALGHTVVTTKHLYSTTTAPMMTDPSTTVKITMPGAANFSNPQSIATINFTTADCISSGMLTGGNATTMPLQLNSTHHHSQGLQIISAPVLATGKELMGKNGLRMSEIAMSDATPPSLVINGKEQPKLDLLTSAAASATKLDTEPPTKVIKLINGSIALASMDKESKIIPSGQLTLSQVMGGSSLVVSPIPFLTPSQSLRVIGSSSNGLATIELSPAGNSGVRTQAHHTIPQATGAQLHKLLATGTGQGVATTMVSTSGVSASTMPSMTPELARLPGGAELNILPAGPNGTIYRGQSGKLAIMNNGITLKGTDVNSANNRAVHVVTPIQSNSTSLSGLTPIVVSQGQGTASLAHIIASSSQLAGKVVTTPLSMNGQGLPLVPGTQYLSTTVMKPMVVMASNPDVATVSSVASTNSLPPPNSTGVTVVQHHTPIVASTTVATNESGGA